MIGIRRAFDRFEILRRFGGETSGQIAVFFALSMVPVMGGVGAAIDYSQANSIKTAMQAAADAASLATVKTAASSTLSASQVTSTAQGVFGASFARPSNSPAGRLS